MTPNDGSNDGTYDVTLPPLPEDVERVAKIIRDAIFCAANIRCGPPNALPLKNELAEITTKAILSLPAFSGRDEVIEAADGVEEISGGPWREGGYKVTVFFSDPVSGGRFFHAVNTKFARFLSPSPSMGRDGHE